MKFLNFLNERYFKQIFKEDTFINPKGFQEFKEIDNYEIKWVLDLKNKNFIFFGTELFHRYFFNFEKIKDFKNFIFGYYNLINFKISLSSLIMILDDNKTITKFKKEDFENWLKLDLNWCNKYFYKYSGNASNFIKKEIKNALNDENNEELWKK